MNEDGRERLSHGNFQALVHDGERGVEGEAKDWKWRRGT